MQTTAIGTVANSLPENEVILLTILISDGYIPYTELKITKQLTLCHRKIFLPEQQRISHLKIRLEILPIEPVNTMGRNG